MKGYTIQHSIDLLEKAVENGSGGGEGTSAANVSYSNTSSGLTADDVQEAIDELTAMIPIKYSLTEQEVGEWVDGSPVYQKTIYCETLPSAKGTGTYDADVANVTNCWVVDATVGASNLNAVRVSETDASAFQTASMYARCGTVDGALKVYIDVGRDRSSLNAYVTVRYTKTAPAPTRSKKK